MSHYSSIDMDASQNPRNLTPTQRKQALRTIYTTIQDLNETVNDQTIYNWKDAIVKIDEIHFAADMNDKVKHQDQVVLDSEVLGASTKLFKTCTEKFHKNESIGFSEKLLDFVHRLPDVTVNEINWRLLAHEIVPYKSVAYEVTLLPDHICAAPPPEVPAKEQKQPAPRLRRTLGPAKRPENVVAIEEQVSSVEQTVEKLRKFIIQVYRATREPIDYYKLILDPNNFGKTVENSLHVSFLALDGKIQLLRKERGRLMVVPLRKDKDREQAPSDKSNHKQNVASIDMAQWQLLKDVYQSVEPMISF